MSAPTYTADYVSAYSAASVALCAGQCPREAAYRAIRASGVLQWAEQLAALAAVAAATRDWRHDHRRAA